MEAHIKKASLSQKLRLHQCSGILFLAVHAAWLTWVIVRAPDTGGGLPACFCVDMLASTATLSLLLVAATGGFWAGVWVFAL